jgi:hypothetical protein
MGRVSRQDGMPVLSASLLLSERGTDPGRPSPDYTILTDRHQHYMCIHKYLRWQTIADWGSGTQLSASAQEVGQSLRVKSELVNKSRTVCTFAENSLTCEYLHVGLDVS